MGAFVIPSIFTAINKVSAPLRTMGKSVHDFAKKMERAVDKANKGFNNILPSLSTIQKEFLSFLSIASLVAAVTAGISFGANAVMDYEDAVASFRTIVSDLSNQDFSAFQKSINQVAKDTKKSGIDVAQSFEKIAGLNAEFAKTSEGLSAVSKASIVLSRASKDELGVAAENLVGIMNQFNLEANQANRAINVLAAGQAVGAASISQTSEAFKNFGSVAEGANISLEQSVALIQVLSKKQILGAEAGTKLRGSILQLQKAGLGYKSGQFKINDALEEANAKMDRLSTAKLKDAFLTKVFGAENITAGRILIGNIKTFKEFTTAVTGTSEAQKAAKINSDTLRNKVEELKASFINFIVTNEDVKVAAMLVKDALVFVANNMETIIPLAATILGLLAGIKTVLLITSGVLAVYNGVQWAWATVQAVNLALQGKTLLFLQGSTTAMVAYKIITAAVTVGTWLMATAQMAYNAALAMGMAPIMLIVAALALVVSVAYSFYRNWEMVKKSFSEGGILGGLKAINNVLADGILYPLQKILALAGRIPGMSWAKDAAEGINGFRAKLGLTMDENSNDSPVVNPARDRQDYVTRSVETKQQNVSIGIMDDTGRAKVKSDNNIVPINLTSTLKFR